MMLTLVHCLLLYFSIGAITFVCTVTLHNKTLDDPERTNLIFRGIIIVCDVKVILWAPVLAA